MDLVTLFLILLGLLFGWILIRSTRSKWSEEEDDELDDWDQQDQLEGDEV